MSLIRLFVFFAKLENKEFIEAISGRSLDNIYCQVERLIAPGTNRFHIEWRNVKYLIHSNRDKSIAINTSNEDTVEIRIFAATSKKSVLLGRLEFVDAIVRFTQTHRKDQMSKKHFISFVEDNKGKYPNLISIINKKHLGK